jgi:hypothetical protein
MKHEKVWSSKDFYVWTSTRTGASDNVSEVVAVHIARRYANATSEVGVECEETQEGLI